MLIFLRLPGRFARADGGAIAILTALSLLVLVLGGGVAIDYGRASHVRQQMQTALDAGTFAAAKASLKEGASVQNVVEAFIGSSELAGMDLKVNLLEANTVADGEVASRMVAHLPTTLMQVGGIEDMKIEVTSKVVFGSGDMKVALVLDSTTSMAGTKLDTLKASALSLVETLDKAGGTGANVQVGVVPFSRYVNVGLEYRTEPWIDVPLEYTHEKCSITKPLISKSGCSMQTFSGSSDGAATTYQAEVCTNYEYGPEEQVCNTAVYKWNGCVGSRDYPLNIADHNYNKRVPGLLGVSCSTPLTPLTGDSSVVKSAINGLWANGDTYIPAGLVWGWRILSDNEPFAQASDTKAKSGKYIVLMTDGANTRSPNYPQHNDSDVGLANDLTAQLCKNIRNKGIEIFTIAFEVTDTTIKDLLQACATPGGAFYDATDGKQLKAAFDDIGGSLVQFRLAK